MLFEVVNVASQNYVLGAGPEYGSAAGNGLYQTYPNNSSNAPDSHSASSGTRNYDTGYLGGLTTASKNPTGRHTDGSNFLFADGHVKWLRGSAISPGYDAASQNDYQGKTANYAAGTSGSFTNGGTSMPVGTFSAI
jgi:prepilin-type processing-associated H-X9-DG protein